MNTAVALQCLPSLLVADAAERMPGLRDARFRDAFNATYQLMGLLTPEGMVIEGNEAALSFAGLRLADIVGRPFWQLPYFRASIELATQMRSAVTRAARGELVRAEVDIQGGENRRMTVDFSIKPILDAAGGISMLIVEGRDICERKRSEQTLRESEERLRLTVSASPIGLAMVAFNGHWLSVNHALCNMLGYSETELVEMSFQDVTYPDDLGPDLDLMQKTLSGELNGYRLDKRYIRKDGHIIPVQIDVTLVRDVDGAPMHFLTHVQDVSERRRFEHLLQQEKERFQVALSSITDAVFITDTRGIVDFVNPIGEHLLGAVAGELLGRRLGEVVDLWDETGATRLPLMVPDAMPAGRGVGRLQRGRLPPLALEYALTPLKDSTGKEIGSVLMLHDVTQARALTRALEHQAMHDPLTGLFNRTRFEHMLELQRRASIEHPRPWCLLYLDLDRFKIVNDTAGHAAGDELLRLLAARLRAVLRATDVFARLGGDEFGVILDRCELVDAERIAAKLIDSVDDFRFRHAGQQFQLGLSIGIAAPPNEVYTVADLLRMADAACYVAKRTGRNRACVYHESGINGVAPVAEFDAVNALQSAFDERRLRVYAQKIFDLETGKTVGIELLTRLVTEDGEIITPDRFLPIAERNDLVTRLDGWMLRSAAALFADGHRRVPDDWFVTLNVSGLSISDLRFHNVISEVMTQGQGLRDRIYFEITESAAPSNWPVTYQGIELLRSHGSRVLLDDFGSGFTSFSYLRNLQVDGLKIAQDFIETIGSDPVNEPVISMVAQLTRKLGIHAIAEGISDAATVAQLHARGIRYGQGFFFHRPEPVENLLCVD